jgi:cytochrome c biogenesis protein CcmG, thiol:disulfide interchange protein DsbE
VAKQPQSKNKSGGTSPRQILLYVGIAVAVGAVLYAAFGLESDDGPTVEEIAGSPEIEGDGLPALNPDAGTDPAMGSPVPVVEGADFDGNPISIGDGPAEIVVFMASWCPACQAELPELVSYLDEQGLPEGVELTVVATSLDANRPPWPPSGWLERGGYTGPVLVDDADGSVAQAYGLSATPFFVASQNGEVVIRVAGQMPMQNVDEIARAIAP